MLLTAEIAADQQAAVVLLEDGEGRAEDVAGAMERDRGAAGQLGLTDGRPELADGPLGIGGVEQGQRRIVTRVPTVAGVLRVLDLEMRGVAQHDRCNLRCTRGADHRAVEALANQAGQVAAVVQVRVGEDDGGQ